MICAQETLKGEWVGPQAEEPHQHGPAFHAAREQAANLGEPLLAIHLVEALGQRLVGGHEVLGDLLVATLVLHAVEVNGVTGRDQRGFLPQLGRAGADGRLVGHLANGQQDSVKVLPRDSKQRVRLVLGPRETASDLRTSRAVRIQAPCIAGG